MIRRRMENVHLLPSIWASLIGLGLLLTVLPLAGCAAPKEAPSSKLWEEAIRRNDRGIEREARGEHVAALKEFAEALRLHAAIENEGGMIVALVNIARTSRLQGELETAREATERAAALTAGVPGLAAEVLFERAKVALAAADLESAGRLAAEAIAAELGTGLAARYNLAALVHYRRGDSAAAKRHAEIALVHCRTPEQWGEEANAHRLLGEIHLGAGEHGPAGDRFAAALGRDKALGRSGRIAQDLRGSAEAALMAGNRVEGIRLLQRARNVSTSAGDVAAAAKDEERLAELGRQAGPQAVVPSR